MTAINFHEKHVRPGQGVKYDVDDFTSLCNLTGGDNDETYVGNEGIKGETTTTIKLGIALCTNATDTGLDASPLAGIIAKIHRAGPKAVRSAQARLKRALHALLTRVFERLVAICDQNHCYIDVVALSVPAQWIQDAQDFLVHTVRQTWQIPGENKIEALFEIDAMAHFCLNDEIAKETILSHRMMEHGHSLILFVDMGGYSMVGRYCLT